MSHLNAYTIEATQDVRVGEFVHQYQPVNGAACLRINWNAVYEGGVTVGATALNSNQHEFNLGDIFPEVTTYEATYTDGTMQQAKKELARNLFQGTALLYKYSRTSLEAVSGGEGAVSGVGTFRRYKTTQDDQLAGYDAGHELTLEQYFRMNLGNSAFREGIFPTFMLNGNKWSAQNYVQVLTGDGTVANSGKMDMVTDYLQRLNWITPESGGKHYVKASGKEVGSLNFMVTFHFTGGGFDTPQDVPLVITLYNE